MNDKFFIQKLKEKREKYGISQSRFAVACGISREHYNRIENGKTPLTEELKQEITKQLERFNPQEPLFLLIDYFRVRFPTFGRRRAHLALIKVLTILSLTFACRKDKQ